MSALIWGMWGDVWGLSEKVSFNGFTKIITVNAGVTTLDIAEDVYSAWVRWTAKEQRFLPAMRYSGFDPIPNGRTGATFFTINGWKLVYDPNVVAITGVLYSSDYDTPYWNTEGFPLYPATVSSLVNSAVSVQNVVTGTALTEEQTANAVWSLLLNSGLSANATLSEVLTKIQETLTAVEDIPPPVTPPTVSQIAQGVWDEVI
jgi:hypothetical protein